MRDSPIATSHELHVGVDVCPASPAMPNHGIYHQQHWLLSLFEQVVGRFGKAERDFRLVEGAGMRWQEVTGAEDTELKS